MVPPPLWSDKRHDYLLKILLGLRRAPAGILAQHPTSATTPNGRLISRMAGPAAKRPGPFPNAIFLPKTFKAKTRGVCREKLARDTELTHSGWSIPLKVNFLRRSTQVTNTQRYRCSLVRFVISSY